MQLCRIPPILCYDTSTVLGELIRLQTPSGFRLSGVATAHGWHALAPYRWDAETGTLHRIEALPGGVTHLRITQPDAILVRADRTLTSADAREAERRLRWSLRLDEDLSAFHALCASDPVLWEAVQPSGGRLLRCPSLWEDTVKTILTTNTTWAQTRAMAARLCAVLGAPTPKDPTLRSFPAPDVVATNEAALIADVRLGYRNASVLSLARSITGGDLDLESLRTSALSTPDLRRELMRLPGIGPYAAATLLMILERYDELAIDTVLRAHVRRKYRDGAAITEREIRALYEPWGRWKYLGYWFDR